VHGCRNEARFSFDFGSAPVEAFESLVEALWSEGDADRNQVVGTCPGLSQAWTARCHVFQTTVPLTDGRTCLSVAPAYWMACCAVLP